MKNEGIFSDPSYLLLINWDKIKVRKNKEENVLNYYVNDFETKRKTNKFDYMYYCNLFYTTGNKAFSFIATLLLQKSVYSIKLKDSKIKLKFDDNTSIDIDILNYELDNYANDIINLAVSNYRKNCYRKVKNVLASDNFETITFNKSLGYESNYKKNIGKLDFLVMSRGNNEFGLNEEEFINEVVDEFLDNENNIINIEKKYINFKSINKYTHEPILASIVLNGTKNNISITYKIDFDKIINKVEEHNKKISDKSLIKKRSNYGKFNNGKNS